MILTFADFKDAHPNAAGTKTVPAKVKGSDGHDYAMSASALSVIQANLGKALEVETTSKTNGAFVNYSVLSARIPATAPESAPTTFNIPALFLPTPPPLREAVVPTAASTSTWKARDPKESLHIVRQSAVKAATELVAADKLPFESLLAFAQTLVNWVYEEESGGLNGGGGEMQGVLPVTRAQAALETARSKQADIRSTYEDADAVCPSCGRKEWLKQFSGGWFCAAKDGGCGFPPKNTRLDAPSTFGEWKQKTANQTATSVPWK